MPETSHAPSSPQPSPQPEDADGTHDPPRRTVTAEPFNAETRLERQLGVLTPTLAFYARNHFAVPRLDAGAWRLVIGGAVDHPYELTYGELRALPSRTLLVTLECAGNGRAYFPARAEGEPWEYGAVSTAEWTGVPLVALLARPGVSATAREILFEGADAGHVPDAGGAIPFARSLPLARALHPDTLLAYAMNGEALPPAHGFPARLIVPGWYGMAAVKWLTRITAIATPFAGFYQADRYVMAHPERGETTRVPLTTVAVRALFTAPAEGETLPPGRRVVRGLAWSGAAVVDRVEVSADGGARWEPAAFTSEPARYAWRRWEYLWGAVASGPATLMCRATDAQGNTQPMEAEWNRLGYALSLIHI